MVGIEIVKALREKTGAGIVDCKTALTKSNGEIEKAIDFLRQRGLTQAGKKADRETKEGLISSYIHPGGRVGVLIEVNCETDFVARNPEFQTLIKDLALHIAGSSPAPQYVRQEDIPSESIKGGGGVASPLLLLEMPFIKDPSVKIKELIAENIAKIGENIQVRRFIRYQLGE
ncbi:MAG: translation elongation factor Ts [Nitrospirae bacterium]|nr:translation elongation factor Ts [Candidatus Troglogloeales bacterium]